MNGKGEYGQRSLAYSGSYQFAGLISYSIDSCAPGIVTFYQILGMIPESIRSLYKVLGIQYPLLFTLFNLTASTDFTHSLYQRIVSLCHTKSGVSYYSFFQKSYVHLLIFVFCHYLIACLPHQSARSVRQEYTCFCSSQELTKMGLIGFSLSSY